MIQKMTQTEKTHSTWNDYSVLGITSINKYELLISAFNRYVLRHARITY